MTLAEQKKLEVSKIQWSKARDIVSYLDKGHQTGKETPLEETFPVIFYYSDKSILIVTMNCNVDAYKEC